MTESTQNEDSESDLSPHESSIAFRASLELPQQFDYWVAHNSYTHLQSRFKQLEIFVHEHNSNNSHWHYGPHLYEASSDMSDIMLQRVMRLYPRHSQESYRFQNESTEEERSATIASLAKAKQEEEWWVTHFASPETSPSDVVGQLSNFWNWLGQVSEWYPTDSYKVGDSKFINPASFRNIVFRSTIEAVKAQPELEDAALDAYSELMQRGASHKEDVDAKIYHSISKVLESYLYLASDPDGPVPDEDRYLYIGFLAQLTDHGRLPLSSWYKYIVVQGGKLPSFDYMDTFRALLRDHETGIRAFREHGSAYGNSLAFGKRVLNDLYERPDRNQEYALAISRKLEELRREGRNSPHDFISVSNLLVPLINNGSGEAPISKLDPRKAENLPLAFWRVLFATRNLDADSETAANQAYEDEVYSDILSFAYSRAMKLHDNWFTKQLEDSTPDANLYRRGRRHGTSYRTGVHRWRKGRPIHARLVS